MIDAALLAHVASTWALVGVIWLVQLVQYPGFALVAAEDLRTFHDHHCRRITWVVAPLMGVELTTGALLLLEATPETLTLLWVGAVLMAVNWVATATVSVPLHGRLSARDEGAPRRLVATNWARTLCWSARGLLVLALPGAG